MTLIAAPAGIRRRRAPAPAPGAGRQVWRRLRARRAAVVAAAVLALLVLLALAAPLLARLEGQDPTTYHADLVDSARGGVPLGSFGGISADHWLGVEPGTGRDLFARLVYGARVSLRRRARRDRCAGRSSASPPGSPPGSATAAWTSCSAGSPTSSSPCPMLVLAIALLAVVPADFPRPVLLILVIGLLGWGAIARIVRAQTLTLSSLRLRRRPPGSPAGGTLADRPPRAAARRWPRPSSPYAALLLPANIVVEAGAVLPRRRRQAAHPVLGADALQRARPGSAPTPPYVLLPAGLLFVTVLAFTVLGDGVRTALDPRERSRLRAGTREGERRA